MKKQVVVINGGNTYETYEEYISHLKHKELDIERFKPRVDWKYNLQKELGDKYEIFLPKMPNSNNAKYEEWKIWFERITPLLNNELILIGHSLGGIFLAKYLSENNVSNKITATILVAAPYDTEGLDESLADFNLPKSLEKFAQQSEQIYLFQSKDDPVVSILQVKKYKETLPEAKEIILDGKGHFNDENFPEIVEIIESVK